MLVSSAATGVQLDAAVCATAFERLPSDLMQGAIADVVMDPEVNNMLDGIAFSFLHSMIRG